MKEKKKTLPPTYFWGLLIALVGLNYLTTTARIIEKPYSYVGWVLVGFGFAINMWTDSLFKKGKTTVKPHEMPTALQVTGPFRLSRHPMYVGMTAVLLGVAVLYGNIWSFVFPVAFVYMMEKKFIPVEEENLEKAFGKEYTEYKEKTRKWLI